MKKHILFLLLFTATVFAQNPKPASELSAEGAGTMKVKPDVIKLTVSVSKQNESEKNALKELNDEVAKLEGFFTKVGISAKSIKIAAYNINDESTDDKGKKLYQATNNLTIEFKLDNKVLDAFYGELQAGNYKDVSADYETSLSDELEKKTKAELVEKAVADAKQNAENIARALGVKITGIKSVSKYTNEGLYMTKSYEKALPVAAASMMMPPPPTSFSRYEVEEVERTENISIVFEISK